MTFAAADMRIEIGAVRFRTVRADLHLLFEERKTPLELRLQYQIAACVCQQYLRDRARRTQFGFPGQGR